MIDSFHSSGSFSFFQIEVISLWISKKIVLPPRFNQFCRYLINTWRFVTFYPVDSQLNSEALGSGTSGSAVCISAYPSSLTPRTLNSWEKYFLHLATVLWKSATKSPFSSLTILHLDWYPFLKSLMPLYKSLMFWILLLVSSSSILALRYAFFLFPKCLLTSRLTLFRISTLLWFGTRISWKGFWMNQILTLSLYLPLKRSASLPGPGNSPPWYRPVELLQVVVTSRGRQSNESGPASKKKKGRDYILVGHVKSSHGFRRLQLQRNSQTTTSKIETPASQKRFTANTDTRSHVRIFTSQWTRST